MATAKCISSSDDDEKVIIVPSTSNQVARKSTGATPKGKKPRPRPPVPVRSESPSEIDIDTLYIRAPDSPESLQSIPASTSSASSSVSSGSRGRRRRGKGRGSASKTLQTTASTFMANFNPDTSCRERRKLNRKIRNINSSYSETRAKPKPPPPGALYDEFGVHIESGMDLCDCLDETCEGCFFDCPKCGSPKCGNDCRVYRDYIIEYAEVHGTLTVIKSPLCPDLNIDPLLENRSCF